MSACRQPLGRRLRLTWVDTGCLPRLCQGRARSTADLLLPALRPTTDIVSILPNIVDGSLGASWFKLRSILAAWQFLRSPFNGG